MRFFYAASVLGFITLAVLGGKTAWADEDPLEIEVTKLYGQRVYADRR